MLLEKDKLSKQKYVAAIFNKHFKSITDYLNLFRWPEDTSMSSGNYTINSINKKFAFHQSIKAVKKKIKIKNEPCIYRDHKMNFKWVCVNEALRTGSFPESLECSNVRAIFKY